MREVHFWQDGQAVPVMPRHALAVGETIEGPFILEEPDTTLVLPPGWRATLGAKGYIVATRLD